MATTTSTATTTAPAGRRGRLVDDALDLAQLRFEVGLLHSHLVALQATRPTVMSSPNAARM